MVEVSEMEIARLSLLAQAFFAASELFRAGMQHRVVVVHKQLRPLRA